VVTFAEAKSLFCLGTVSRRDELAFCCKFHTFTVDLGELKATSGSFDVDREREGNRMVNVTA